MVKSFSVARSLDGLFRVDNMRSMTVEYMKLGFAMFFIFMHAISGSDNPYGPVVISRRSASVSTTDQLHSRQAQ